MTFNIEVETKKQLSFDYKKIIDEVINKVLEFENCPYETEVNLVLTDDEEIHSINMEYRGIDSPTDVLSFPMIDYISPSDFSIVEKNEREYFNPETGELILGDIIISVDKVYEQAKCYNHSDVREFAFLITHSMLHLCGYDHMVKAEANIMEEKQSQILSELGINR